MRKILLAALMLAPLALYAQYPGGIGNGLKLWLKANSGVSLNPTNTVAQWNELSGAGITGDFATQGANIGMGNQNPPAYQPGGINFNPQLVFVQTGPNSISSNNAFSGLQLIDAYNNTMLQVIRLHTISGTGVWFKWQYSNTNVNRLGNEVNNGGANAGKIRFDFRGINNFSSTIVNDKYVLAGMNTTQAQNTIRINGANDNVMNYASQAAFAPPAASTARLTLGNEEYGDAYPTTIDIAEVILFSRTLSAAERNKVESYLAVKYGFTLDQSAASANNYTASDGTVTWNRTANLPFVQNITGIGRDDGDSLIQRQSRSINAAGLVTMYYGNFNGNNFPALNTSNANNFPADNTYLLFGDNGASIALDRCFSGNPAFLRMNRVWKTQMTGNMGTVTFALKAGDVPVATTHLLVSSDSAFTPANTTAYRLDAMNGFLSKALVLPPNSYFTFASDSLILRPSSNSPLCVGSTIQLKASTPAPGTFSWTGPAGFSSTLQNPTIPAAAVINTGMYTVNASINGCAFEPGSVSVTVSPMPPPPTVTTPLYYCQNDTAQALSAVGQELSWYAAPKGGIAFPAPPMPNTDYEGNFVWWVTQANNGCESIRSKQEVIVRRRPNGIIVGTERVICQGDVDSFFYYGDAKTDNYYDWKSPLGKSAVLSGSGQGPLVVRFDSSGVIPVRLQINNEGCVSREMIFSVMVNPRPMAHVVLQSDACIGDVVPISLNALTKGITGYVWDFDGGDTHYSAPPGGPYGISWGNEGDKTVSLVTYSEGCPSFTSKYLITVHAPPAAHITSTLPDRVCLGDSLMLAATPDDSGNVFSWTPAPFFPSQSGAIAWGRIARSGFVRVDVTSLWGCQASDSILINPESCCSVAFPSAFTPDGNGRNDRFHIITNGHHEISNFRIVNRWGQTVFETRDEANGWDGTFNGKPQEIGTYFYYIRFRCGEGKGHMVEQKGEFILIR